MVDWVRTLDWEAEPFFVVSCGILVHYLGIRLGELLTSRYDESYSISYFDVIPLQDETKDRPDLNQALKRHREEIESNVRGISSIAGIYNGLIPLYIALYLAIRGGGYINEWTVALLVGLAVVLFGIAVPFLLIVSPSAIESKWYIASDDSDHPWYRRWMIKLGLEGNSHLVSRGYFVLTSVLIIVIAILQLSTDAAGP
jgi:hypothetical protein